MADNFNILDSEAEFGDRLVSGEALWDRRGGFASAAHNNQAMRVSYFTAQKTETISQVQVWTTGTAAGATPTLCRIGVWTAGSDGALTSLVAATDNDTALFGTQNTRYTKSFAAPFTKQRGQRYGVGVLVVTGAAAPTLVVNSTQAFSEWVVNAPRLASAVTGQADLPATVAVGSLVAATSGGTQGPYAVLLP